MFACVFATMYVLPKSVLLTCKIVSEFIKYIKIDIASAHKDTYEG